MTNELSHGGWGLGFVLGGGGVERYQISDPYKNKISDITVHTPYKIKYQISDPKQKNKISDITPHKNKISDIKVPPQVIITCLRGSPTHNQIVY